MPGLRRRPPPGAIPLPLPGLAPPVVEPPPAHAPPEPRPPAQPAPPAEPLPPADPAPPAQPLAAADPAPAADPLLDVRVVRSRKRTRTSSARLVGQTLEIRLPAWMSAADEAHWVAEWTRRFRRKLSTDRIDLAERAATLAGRHDLPRPTSVRWVDDMRTRWGSCTPSTGAIRLSSALAPFPDWVVDYVIVHELAHLREAGHTTEFWRLVARYPRAERARGYLIAKSGDTEDSW
jgi:predicted metal-dependent hydrolase